MTRFTMSLRESDSHCERTSAFTSSANRRDVATHSDFSHPLPCSACERRSAATHFAGTEPSARTAISLGPATWSIATYP